MLSAAYDSIAEWYDQSIRQGTLYSSDDLIPTKLFSTIGTLEGAMICDLACGQGEMARQMARLGAKVVGVDVSRKLLDIALREEESHPQGIVYQLDDAQLLSSLTETVFEGVFCSMALMDIPDLDATLRSVQRVLRPEGWFVFTITHPCFQKPPMRGYYEEGFWRSDNPNGVRGQVGAHHRTLSTYLNAVSKAGMFVQWISEPCLPGRDVPVVLAALCRMTAS